MILVNPIDSYEARMKAQEKNKEEDEKRKKIIEYLKSTGELTEVELENLPMKLHYITGAGNVKKAEGFLIDENLKYNLDEYLIRSVDKKWDGLFIESGMEGCISIGGEVLMANGTWKKVEEIKVGDIVLSPQFDGSSKFSKVLKTYKFNSKENYEVTDRNNNQLFKCSFNHRLLIPTREKNGKMIELAANDLFNGIKKIRNPLMMTSFPISSFMNRTNCEIEPYTLGAFLGDGSFIKQLRITNSYNDKEMITEIKKFYKPSFSYDDKRNKNIVTTYGYNKGTKLYDLLKKYNLNNKRSGDKFIPKEALTSDLKYRIRLLSGLIDTDGSIHKGTYSIKTKSKQLAKDIKNLIYSIGGRAKINIDDWNKNHYKNANRYYRISFYISTVNLEVKVKRKIKKDKCFVDSNKIRINIKKSNPGWVYGFLLDSPSHLFITNEWCLSFNSGKTTHASAVCKYLDQTFPGEPLNDGTPRRHCNRIVFTGQQFSEAVAKSKPKQAIQFDEAILALLAGDAGTTIQRMIMKEITLIRKKQLYIVLVIPSIFSMRMPIAAQRSRFLIHTWSPNGIDRGYFKFYNYPTKRQLYIKGKRDFNQDAVESDFDGNFADTEGLFYDHEEYNKKKDQAIRSLADNYKGYKNTEGSGDYKTNGQRNLLLYYIYTLLGDDTRGKEQLEKIVELHNKYATAIKAHDKLSVNKFKEWLITTFGEHMTFSPSTLSEYMEKAVDFISKPLKPLKPAVEFGKFDNKVQNDIPEDDTPKEDFSTEVEEEIQ